MNVFKSNVFAAYVWASNVLHGGSATTRARGGDGGDDAKIHRRRGVLERLKSRYAKVADENRLREAERQRIEEEEFVVALLALEE